MVRSGEVVRRFHLKEKNVSGRTIALRCPFIVKCLFMLFLQKINERASFRLFRLQLCKKAKTDPLQLCTGT